MADFQKMTPAELIILKNWAEDRRKSIERDIADLLKKREETRRAVQKDDVDMWEQLADRDMRLSRARRALERISEFENNGKK
jgi:hypothetical protein